MSTSASDPDGKHLATQLTLAMEAGAGHRRLRQRRPHAARDVIGASGPLDIAAVHGRILPASSREVACLRVELPAETGNAYQGASHVRRRLRPVLQPPTCDAVGVGCTQTPAPRSPVATTLRAKW